MKTDQEILAIAQQASSLASLQEALNGVLQERQKAVKERQQAQAKIDAFDARLADMRTQLRTLFLEFQAALKE